MNGDLAAVKQAIADKKARDVCNFEDNIKRAYSAAVERMKRSGYGQTRVYAPEGGDQTVALRKLHDMFTAEGFYAAYSGRRESECLVVCVDPQERGWNRRREDED